MRRFIRHAVLAAIAAALFLVAAPAWAHVTVRVDNPAPESFAKYTVRVPNEADDAATTKVEIELPDGYEEVRVQPLEGWDIAVDGGVLTISGGEIAPGQFQEFGFSGQNPAEEGDIIFPAVQTYDNGDVVRWVGEADSDEPAPVVTIAGEAAGHGTSDDATEAAAETTASTSGVSTTLPTILSVLALILAAAALVRSGRRA